MWTHEFWHELKVTFFNKYSKEDCFSCTCEKGDFEEIKEDKFVPIFTLMGLHGLKCGIWSTWPKWKVVRQLLKSHIGNNRSLGWKGSYDDKEN